MYLVHLCVCCVFVYCLIPVLPNISEIKILMFLLQCCWSFWSSRREVQPPHLLTATQHNSQSFGKKCWTVQGSVTTNFLRTLHSKWTASLHMHDFAEGIISWSSMLGVTWLPPPPHPHPPTSSSPQADKNRIKWVLFSKVMVQTFSGFALTGNFWYFTG